ncbi:MAG: lysylphosphatidylglycerol synthase domain-containing protein, partial [bacterium]
MILRSSRGLWWKLAVSLVLLGWLARRYGGDPSFRATLARLDAASFLTAEAVVVGGLVLSALRWRILLGAAGVPLGLGPAIRLYLVGYFFNFFLPTTVGGDVARAMGVGKGTPLPVVAGSILVERLVGFGSLLAVGIIASFAMESLAVAR